jgi:hypothetical protein
VDEVRVFDAAWIHNNVPEDTSGDEAQDFRSALVSPDWYWHDSELVVR